jgi:hypothetical protein
LGIPEEGDTEPGCQETAGKVLTKGDPMITINLENDDQNDLFVSVKDLNQAGSPVVLNQARINQGEALAVEIQEDGHGSGKVTWAAQRVDDATQAAQRTVTVDSGDTVEVTTFFG